MFSGLYSDLPDAKDASATKSKEESTPKSSTWSGTRMPQPTPITASSAHKPNKSSIAMPPPSILLRSSNSSRGRGRHATPSPSTQHSNTYHKKIDSTPPSHSQAPPPTSISYWDSIKDEYDPAQPNDYDTILHKREQQRREAEVEAEKQDRLREQQRAAGVEAEKQQHIQQVDEEERRKMMLNMSGEEAFRRRAGLSANTTTSSNNNNEPLSIPTMTTQDVVNNNNNNNNNVKGMTLAQKMLEKMGWKKGEGLGKNKQGIITPLSVKKTDVHSGKIIQSPSLPHMHNEKMLDKTIETTKESQICDIDISSEASRVIVLRNVVPPGGVGENLDMEIGEECSKYGDVTSVLIFEVTEENYPETEAVRVFVEFNQLNEASTALSALHGRYFGGRLIKANYFDQQRFDDLDLAPKHNEKINRNAG